ncbi:MAG TPA: Hpt domain-containing protein [bacterium]|nr:Hpt domain-containing protein [bacterium]
MSENLISDNDDIVKEWLNYFDNDPDFTIVTFEFVKTLPNYIQKLEKFFVEKNQSELQKIAHSLKGSSGSVGAFDMCELFTQMDLELKKEKPDYNFVNDLFCQIKTIYNKIPKKYFEEA